MAKALGTAPAAAPAVRSDVRRNRQALLQAARELLAVRNDVPMYEIARHAGVGQATLYRHFPDRRALIGAVAGEVLDTLEAEAATIPPGPDALMALLRLLAGSMVNCCAMFDLIEEESSDPRQPGTVLYDVVQRLRGLMAERFEESRGAGELRPDLVLDDVVLVLGMVKGVIEGLPSGAREAAAGRALELALRGVLARGGR